MKSFKNHYKNYEVLSQTTSEYELRKKKVEEDLQEIETLDDIIEMLQKTMLKWSRV